MNRAVRELLMYTFPGGRVLTLLNVTHFANRPSSGTHRLRTEDGRLWIVHPEQGWNIEIDTAEWTV